MILDEEVKKRILDAARKHFFRLGFSKVTMSEIAEDLGMSKKTLYEYFPSKETLLAEVIAAMQHTAAVAIDAILNDTTIDFIEKMKRLLSHGAEFHSKFSKHLLLDLQRNAPHVWSCCDEFRIKRLRKIAEQLFREGIEKGIFRNDINEEVLILIYTTVFQNLVTPETFVQSPYSMKQFFDTLNSIVFEGILTPEARMKDLSTIFITQ